MRLEKMRTVSQRIAEPVSTIYWRISRGEFPPTIKQGERAAALIVEEVDAVVRARAAGASGEEIKALVRQLIAARRTAA